MMRLFTVFCVVILSTAVTAKSLPLNLIKLPPHFKISLYAKVTDARSLALGPNGIVFVGTRAQGDVYALIPNKSFSKASQVIRIAQDLNQPNGVTYFNGALYVAEIHRILAFPNIVQQLKNPKKVVLYDKLPTNKHHGWRYIGIGPDNWLYIAIGAPCNICVSKLPFATISRLSLDGKKFEVYAKGVRNSVGFDWSPSTKALWFTDNGGDWLGDNIPPDELNNAPTANMNFGYPYFWGNNQPYPTFGKNKSSKGMTPPALALGPHVAALGMRFYTGHQFPKTYFHQIFIAEHGSWNRSQKIGYRITLVKLKNNQAISRSVFASGWLQGQKYWGRPVDVLTLPDGSLLVSDDYADAVYRISYTGLPH